MLACAAAQCLRMEALVSLTQAWQQASTAQQQRRSRSTQRERTAQLALICRRHQGGPLLFLMRETLV